MALLFFPRFLSSAFPPRLKNTCFCSLSPQTSVSTSNARSRSAILWFKQDLRLDDHPGLVQASNYPALLPLYVLDHRILSRYSDKMLEIVLFALQDLRKCLYRDLI